VLIPADEVTATLHICDPTPTVSMQRNNISRRDRGLQNAHAVIFEQKFMMSGRGDERVQRVRPSAAC